MSDKYLSHGVDDQGEAEPDRDDTVTGQTLFGLPIVSYDNVPPLKAEDLAVGRPLDPLFPTRASLEAHAKFLVGDHLCRLMADDPNLTVTGPEVEDQVRRTYRALELERRQYSRE